MIKGSWKREEQKAKVRKRMRAKGCLPLLLHRDPLSHTPLPEVP